MESNKIYRVLVLGPMGVGKSQFCNFVQNDIHNSINKVRFSLNPCTQDPKPNFFEKEGIQYEFIDTAGNGDSPDIDENNLKKLVNYLKSVKKIDYILLLLSFGERVSNDTKEYIKKLGKIFTPMEFYNHLSIIFTKSPESSEKISKKNAKKYSIMKEEITEILKKTFDVKDTLIDKYPEVYFLDTYFDEDTKCFDVGEEFVKTLNILLKQLRLNADKYNSIKTINIDIEGENVKLRIKKEQKELDILKEKIKNEKKEQFQKNYKNEELDNLISEKKKVHEEFNKRQEEIDTEAKNNGVHVDKLEGIKPNSISHLTFIITSAAGGLLTFGGLLLTAVLPEVGPIIASAGIAVIYGGVKIKMLDQ